MKTILTTFDELEKGVRLPSGMAYSIVVKRSDVGPEEPEVVTLRFKLLDLLAEPVVGAAVSVDGEELTTDATGMIEVEAEAGASGIAAIVEERPVCLDVGGLDATADDVGAWKARLFNMGFLWNLDVEPDDDEMIIALQDFQAQYGIAVNGQLDAATKAKLIEVYGC